MTTETPDREQRGDDGDDYCRACGCAWSDHARKYIAREANEDEEGFCGGCDDCSGYERPGWDE